VLVPDVFWPTPRPVLTLEYLEGTRLTEVIAGPMSPDGRRRLAIVLVRAMLRQALRDGVYHADPHLVTCCSPPTDGWLSWISARGFLDENCAWP